MNVRDTAEIFATAAPAGRALDGPGLPLPEELSFYGARAWCMDPFLTADAAVARLREAADGFGRASGWTSGACATDAYLLACGLLGAADERLRGRVLRVRRRLAVGAAGRVAVRMGERWLGSSSRAGEAEVLRWRAGLRAALDPLLEELARAGGFGGGVNPAAVAALERFASETPPAVLKGWPVAIASCFRRLDLAPADFLELADRIGQRIPDLSRPVLLLGLRTSGSYMAPLIAARLRARGRPAVSEVTVHPDKGPSSAEAAVLRSHARGGSFAVAVDDAPSTGSTAVSGLDLLRASGFPNESIAFCAPTHPASRNWARGLPADMTITLEPEAWSQCNFLRGGEIEDLLVRYVEADGFIDARVVSDHEAKVASEGLARGDVGKRGARLKRVFAVAATAADGGERIIRVLVKSVGWGWFGYSAFVAGERLAGLTPRLLGVRRGFMFTEWTPQPPGVSQQVGRAERIGASTRYVAARARKLRLDGAVAPNRGRGAPRTSRVDLEKCLSHAFGRPPASVAWRGWLRERLDALPRGPETWIDANMGRGEWVVSGGRLLKADHEHHGLGKAEVNETDPAYDLAATLLAHGCTQEEEDVVVGRYIAESGDHGVADRLWINKLLVGVTTMEREAATLATTAGSPGETAARQDRLIETWHYLTVQAARQCGALVAGSPCPIGDDGPLLSLDVDGVIDKRVFGFPTATAAALRALGRFRAAGMAAIVNTARSIGEVREYCDAYGFQGGVAEYGACLWDAAARRQIPLCAESSLQQMEELRKALRSVPGVCVDARYGYSVRAYFFHPRPRGDPPERFAAMFRPHAIGAWTQGPVPAQIVAYHMERLRLDRLRAFDTSIDTTIVADECDKGTGLRAFREMVAGDVETLAVGDSRSDIPMFQAATHAFAPGHMDCRREARLAGCRVVAGRFQNGLEEIATIVTGLKDGPWLSTPNGPGEALFLKLIEAADRSTMTNFARALSWPATYAAALG